MDRHETHCRYNLAESCVDSLTVGDLLSLAGLDTSALADLAPVRLGYGAIEGSGRLRRLIAGLYDRQTPENVLVTHGAAGANALVYAALVEPGDRVITVQPAYQQHLSIPESYGADLHILPLRAEDRFLPDLGALRRLAGTRPRLIAVTNPNNPTGALMARAQLEHLAEIAAACGAWVLCDEVYRGLDQEAPGTTTSMADLYERGISTGSMSKVYGLAGLRLGWMAGPPELLARAMRHRDYTTISVGVLDDWLAALALEHAPALLARNRGIVRANLAALDAWVETEPRASYVKPRSGTTALVRIDGAAPSEDWCTRLLDVTGVLVTPGSAMGMDGHIRIGFGNSPAAFVPGLAALSQFLGANPPRS
jgi:aspartate/methionine/tyrosine aminotransferase